MLITGIKRTRCAFSPELNTKKGRKETGLFNEQYFLELLGNFNFLE